jgi:hypothetical protein
MRLSPLIAASLLLASTITSAEQSAAHNFVPPEGYVPNADAAIQIAVAVWGPIYGAEKIEREKPYRASLRNGVWVVEGSLPPQSLGGVAIAEISKKDGRILKVSHGK